jgi:hypothetical protein
MVRITTWNVNGIRNPFGYEPWRKNRTFSAMFDILETDIIIMQELKIQRKDLTDDMVLVPGWDCYFSLPKHKKGTRLVCTNGALHHVLIVLQDILVLEYTPVSLYVLLSELKKVFLEFSVHLVHRHPTASDLPQTA